MKSNQKTTIKNTHVIIKTKINPTEEQTKIENSIQNIMGKKITIKKTDNDFLIVEGDSNSLSLIKENIIKNDLKELAYNILNNNLTKTMIKFYINKQSAFNNEFHMIDESMSPLGDIEVEIISDNPQKVIEWIIS